MKTARKQTKRETRSQRRMEKRTLRQNPLAFSNDAQYHSHELLHFHRKEVAPLRPLTKAQDKYLQSIEKNTITFAIGPAGTGKTYVAGSYAANQLKEGLIEKIIITRPAVEAGESFGFLPGELEEKYAPFIEPFRDVLNERLGKSQVDYFLSHGKIVASPLSFMRGKTFKDCIVILDEAQNTTPEQMKMFLTRIGENCKIIVDGDLEQTDINGKNGLQDAIRRLECISTIGLVEFSLNDIVRHGLIKEIIRAYAK